MAMSRPGQMEKGMRVMARFLRALRRTMEAIDCSCVEKMKELNVLILLFVFGIINNT